MSINIHKFTRIESMNCISVHRARYGLEKENKKITTLRLNTRSRIISKNLKRLMRKEDKISIVIMACSITNQELGFYIEQIANGVSVLGVVYVYPEFRGSGLLNNLMSHYEDHCKHLSSIEVDPDEVGFSKSLYEKWGFTKTVGGLLPNNYLLIKEADIPNFLDLANTLKQAA
jgi:predicted GNAT family N-acyltransferase